MPAGELIGGEPAVTIKAPDDGAAPGFVEATVLPGRGMMPLQGDMLETISAPGLDEAARRLDGGADDVAGNASFGFDGAILAPYANRITGELRTGGREVETTIAESGLRFPCRKADPQYA
jgi:hypothetical protein